MSLSVQQVPARGYAVFDGADQVSLCFYSASKAARRAEEIAEAREVDARVHVTIGGNVIGKAAQKKPTRARKCITCWHTVESEGAHHRMCADCRSKSEYDGSA